MMPKNDLFSNKIILKDDHRLPKAFIAFSSKGVRNEKKTYNYSQYFFTVNCTVTMKVDKKRVELGVDENPLLKYTYKDMIPFIQLGPGCEIELQSYNQVLVNAE